MLSRDLLPSSAVALLWAVAPAPLQAQEAAADAGIEDIVVTAQRTESTAQKTPLALTVLGGEALETQGIKEAADLSNKVPNVNVANNVGTMTVNIRGIGTNNDNQSQEPAVNINVDGVYLSRATSAAGAFYDIERIEALRGPQGTLYGRNSTGGSLNIITRKPVQQYEGRAEIEVGRFDLLRTFGMLNVPVVTDKVAIRAAFQTERRDGYTNNAPVTDYNDADSISGRLHILVTPSEDVSLLLSADYTHLGGVGATHMSTPLANDSFTVPLDTEGKRDTPLFGASATFNWKIGGADLTYIGAYRRFHRYQLYDNDFKATPAERDPYAVFDWRNSNWSHELRLASAAGSAVRWVLGGFYYNEDNSYYFTSYNSSATTNSTCSCIPDATAKSYAVFGQATVPLAETFSLTGGLRYTHDRKGESGETIITPVTGAPSIIVNEADLKFNNLSGKVGFEWNPTQRNLIYGTVSNGYKAGGYFDGFNNRYQPEKLLAYELGSKNRFLDDRLQLNLAAFYYDYKNFQANYILTLPGGARVVAIGNARKARNYGIELESLFQPSADDRLELNVTYLNARFVDFVLNSTPPQDYSGLSMPRSPKWTLSGGYSHSFRMANGGKVVAGVRSYFQTGTYLMFQQFAGSWQDAYTRTDLDITYNAPGGRWYLGAYLRNIENSVVASNAAAGPGNVPALDLAPPRTYGMRLGAHF